MFKVRIFQLAWLACIIGTSAAAGPDLAILSSKIDIDLITEGGSVRKCCSYSRTPGLLRDSSHSLSATGFSMKAAIDSRSAPDRRSTIISLTTAEEDNSKGKITYEEWSVEPTWLFGGGTLSIGYNSSNTDVISLAAGSYYNTNMERSAFFSKLTLSFPFDEKINLGFSLTAGIMDLDIKDRASQVASGYQFSHTYSEPFSNYGFSWTYRVVQRLSVGLSYSSDTFEAHRDSDATGGTTDKISLDTSRFHLGLAYSF